MKKTILAILLAVLVGALITLPILPLKGEESSLVDVYVLQTGVFSNLENALEQKNILDGAVIYLDKDQYRVLVGASMNESGLDKIESVLNEKEIPYYKKVISVLEKDDLIKHYNLMLEKTNDKDSILLLNQKILENVIS